MKICFTLNDASGAAHIGMDLERRSYVVEIDDKELPPEVRSYFDGSMKSSTYYGMSLSVVHDFEPCKDEIWEPVKMEK